MTRARGLPKEVRLRLAEELTGHLIDAAREYENAGWPRRRAESLALRDFGDPRRIRTDLSRAWRGRRTVLFPQAPFEHIRSFFLYDLKPVVIILAAVFLVRWQVVQAYHIPTKSMEPTLHGDEPGGDQILVNKLYFRLEDPERFQIAVFTREGDDERNLIKRIAGLSGETIDIRNGDVYIDHRIAPKPEDVQEVLLVPVYGRNRDLVGELDGITREGLAAWIPPEGGEGMWSEIRVGRFFGTVENGGRTWLRWPREILDEYPGGSPRSNPPAVGDLVLSFRVLPGEDCEEVGAVLREGQDVFEVSLPVKKGAAVLFRNKEEIARFAGFLPARRETEIRFANLDDRVTVALDGTLILAADIPNASTVDDASPAVTNRAEFGFRAGSAVFSRIRLWRDIHYRDSGKLPRDIPEGHVFMLGDNSANSEDSRSWGTVPIENLIGKPLFVIWPPARMKEIR